ncbi:MAG: hypothetical protein Q8Q06_01515 [bacterium]|nr:hypothetical protein [bacterium]
MEISKKVSFVKPILFVTIAMIALGAILFFSYGVGRKTPYQPVADNGQNNPAILVSENPESIIDNEFVITNTGLGLQSSNLYFKKGNLLSLGEEGVTRFAARYDSALSYEETKTNIKSILTQNSVAYEETLYENSTGYTGIMTHNGKTASFTIGVADSTEIEPVFMTIFYESR